MVNTTQKISQSPVPDLEQFRAIAAQKDDRVISKRGEVKEPSTFHKGHKFASVSEGVLRKKIHQVLPRKYQNAPRLEAGTA